MSASSWPGLAIPKTMTPAIVPTTAKGIKAVYAHVDKRDGLRCRACGAYAGIDVHRHHLRGRRFHTIKDVCNICLDCHGKMHVRIGGKTLKIYGDAEQRNRSGVPNGLTIEMRQQDGAWIREEGR